MHPVLDSLDNYKILSEIMNVLTIYLPCRKLPVASNLRRTYRENSCTCLEGTKRTHEYEWPINIEQKTTYHLGRSGGGGGG